MHEIFDSGVIIIACDNKSRRSWVKHCVSSSSCVLIFLIVIAKGPNKTCLLTNASIYFKVIKQVWPWRRSQTLVKLVILTESKIKLFPEEISMTDTKVFACFIPVAAFSECLLYLARVVSLNNSKSKCSLECLLAMWNCWNSDGRIFLCHRGRYELLWQCLSLRCGNTASLNGNVSPTLTWCPKRLSFNHRIYCNLKKSP